MDQMVSNVFIPDCLSCGACCRVFGVVEVTTDEIESFPDKIVSTELGYWRMKTNGFVCTCLSSDNKCSIYETRPRVCKAFMRGGELCLMAINQYALISKC